VWGLVLFRWAWKFAGLKLYWREDTVGLGRYLVSALFIYYGFRKIILLSFCFKKT